MTDKFANLEEPKSNALLLVMCAFGLIFIILAYRLLTSASEPIQGVVESVEPVRVVNAHGASVENVSVRLTDGSVVPAQVANSSTLRAGDEVRVMEQRTPGMGPSYQVIAKNRGPES